MLTLTAKVGLIGDVHQEDRYLERALRRLRDLGVEPVLCAGDVVDGEGDASRCIDLLAAGGVHVVRGNHDRWLLRGAARDLPDALPMGKLDAARVAWLEGLPPSRRFDTPAGALLLCHGLGDDDMASVKADDYGYALEVNDQLNALINDPGVQIVVNGHTHQRMVRQFAGLTIVNAGTLLRYQSPGFGVLDFDRREVAFYEFGPVGIAPIEQHALE